MSKLVISTSVWIILSFIAIYFIWGTTYLAILIGLEGFPPFLMAAFRFLIAGVIMVSFCLLRGEKLPSLSSIFRNAYIGMIILIGGQGLLFWSEQYIDSGYAAILVATLPIWFVVLDRKSWSLYFTNPYIVAGIIIGFVGILFLFKDALSFTSGQDYPYIKFIASLAVLFGSVCWVAGSLIYRSKPSPGSMYSNLGWQLLTGSVLATILSFSIGELSDFSFAEVSLRAWSAVVYLAVAGSVVAFVAYTWLLTQKPAAIVGTYAYINPIVAVFLGWLLADEQISAYELLGMIIILTSAVMVNITRKQVHEELAKDQPDIPLKKRSVRRKVS